MRLNVSLLLFALSSNLAHAAVPEVSSALLADYRATLASMVHADTSNPPGNEDRIAQLVASRLKAAGIPYEVLPFAPGRSNLVARLKSTGAPTAKPLLLLAHLDVVNTKDQAWSSAPHTLVEKDGYLVGRGSGDDLSMAAANLEIFLRLKADHVPLRRDVILAFTGDEESGGEGIRYLLSHRPELIDAAVALNEGGGPVVGESGAVQLVGMQTAEKTYQDFRVEAKGPTGHSSVPVAGNAIYRLAAGLTRLAEQKMPAHLLPVTRAYFGERASTASGAQAEAMHALAASEGELPAAAVAEVEKDPTLDANLRTTCVATMISGGTKENALPPTAQALINCRILPDESLDLVEQRLRTMLADPGLSITRVKELGVAGSSPLEGEGPAAIAAVAHELWPAAPVVPVMSRGATDSRHLRLHGIAAYGVSAVLMSEADARRAHGIDERIPVAGIKPGLEFLQGIVLRLAAK